MIIGNDDDDDREIQRILNGSVGSISQAAAASASASSAIVSSSPATGASRRSTSSSSVGGKRQRVDSDATSGIEKMIGYLKGSEQVRDECDDYGTPIAMYSAYWTIYF